jgi:hypothetical protein
MIASGMGLGDAFFSELATVMLCHRMSLVTTKLWPEMLVARIEQTLADVNIRIRQHAYLAYAVMAVFADTPVRPALAAFRDQPSRTLAKQHYLAGLTSPTWVNDKLVQDASGTDAFSLRAGLLLSALF